MFGNGMLSLSTTTIVASAATAVVVVMILYNKSNKDSKSKKNVKKLWDTRVVRDHGPLKNIWPNVLYTLEAPGCSMGPPVRNMHIYRVPDGSNRLVIYNGVSISDATIVEIEALGTPTILVVPNWMHREDAAIWKHKFPNITVVCPSKAISKALEEVSVDMSIQEWVVHDDWSPYITVKDIDGWVEFEHVFELRLETVDKEKDGKIAMVVCDLLFTLVIDCPSYFEKFINWFFDSCIVVPSDPNTKIIVPAVSRIARIFAIKDWGKVEQWYRNYAKDKGTEIAVILVGHGVPVVQVNPTEGCIKALEGIADQLIKPRW